MRQVLPALRLDRRRDGAAGCWRRCACSACSSGRCVDRAARVCAKGKPDAVAHAEARVAVQRQAEAAAHAAPLRPRRTAPRSPAPSARRARPRYQGRPALMRWPPISKGTRLHRIHRRVAHQVDAVRVGAGAAQHAAGIDERHEHQPHRLELAVQRRVPAQAHRPGCRRKAITTCGADALQAVHAAEEADGRHAGSGLPSLMACTGRARPKWSTVHATSQCRRPAPRAMTRSSASSSVVGVPCAARNCSDRASHARHADAIAASCALPKLPPIRPHLKRTT